MIAATSRSMVGGGTKKRLLRSLSARLAIASNSDPIHRRQLAAWCTAKANPADRDLSFAQACKRHGCSEKTAERNVERALTALLLALNRDAQKAINTPQA